MSLAQRILQFQFSGGQPFSGSPSGSFTVSGLRAAVSIQGSQGRLGSLGLAKIWGLSLAQMNAYCTVIPAAIGGGGLSPVTLTITAGEIGGGLAEVINAGIWESYIDLTGAPDSCFVTSIGGIYAAAKPMAPQSQPGAQNAESLIASICAGAGFKLNNNGAHAVLRNQATYGSALDQIETIARAAGFAWAWSGTTFSIWPENQTIDNTVVQVGPNTTPRLVGYPQYYETGIIITSLFNPEVKLGRRMEVVGSILTKANGIWQIVGVQHDLTTMLQNGPWFTTAKLAAIGI
jgi:hypothetical protein